MAEYRNILADGDLIRERKALGWWLFGEQKWVPYRNLSREVRCLKERMDAAHAAYKSAQELFVVAQKNVQLDIDLLRMHKMDNSEVTYELPADESILSFRDGVKYSFGNQSGQKQKGQNGNGNGQQNNQKGGGQQEAQGKPANQNQSNKQGKGQTKSLLELLASAKITFH